MAKLAIRAIPNSSKSELVCGSDFCTAYLKSPPEKGKANSELLKLLRRKYGGQPKIVSGKSSKTKIIEV